MSQDFNAAMIEYHGLTSQLERSMNDETFVRAGIAVASFLLGMGIAGWIFI